MSFRLALFLLFGAIFGGLMCVAQSPNPGATGLLTGRISDRAEGAPIRYAFVLIHQHSGDADQKAQIDSNGKFALSLPPGLYDVFVAADSFAPKCEKVRIVDGKTTSLDITLSPDIQHLESRLEIPIEALGAVHG